jgi:hypothetical protein
VSACVWQVLIFPDAYSSSLSVESLKLLPHQGLETELHRQVAARWLCVHKYYGRSRYSQMHAGLCHSLHCVLALPTQLGGSSERERKRKGKKMHQISQGYLTLFLAVPIQQTDRWVGSSSLSLCWAVRCFKKLVWELVNEYDVPSLWWQYLGWQKKQYYPFLSATKSGVIVWN